MTYILPFLTLLYAAVALAAPPTINLADTKLVGRSISTLQQEFFGGIPFAEPPTGNLRLRPPVPVTSLSSKTVNGAFDATNFGLACLQTGLNLSASSEDCLTINVLRPAGVPAGTLLPVMAWVYGGGFQDGTASIYNGSGIVAESVSRGTPVIYVNFNYRLGPLGFPQGSEAGARGDLNLGLRDQLAGLEWIQKNIGLFGGDRHKVTVFGESAGAICIAILFLNSHLESLVRAAIFESGSAATTPAFRSSRSNAEVDWANFVKAVPSCASEAKTGDTIPCLQGGDVDSATLLNAIGVASKAAPEQFPWSPVVDGPGGLMPDIPSELFKRGQFARIPFITGTNLDEGTLFTAPNLNYTTDVIREDVMANFTPSLLGPGSLERVTDRLLELYPDVPALGSPFNTGNETFGLSSGFKRIAALLGDISFQSQRRAWIQTASKAGVKTFGYLFTDPQPPSVGPTSLGVFHSTEIVYVYGSVNTSPAAKNLSGVMMDYWISFATSLDPNDGKGHPRPKWLQYTPQQQVLMQLNGQNTTIIPDDYRKEQIDFIMNNRVVFHQRRRGLDT